MGILTEIETINNNIVDAIEVGPLTESQKKLIMDVCGPDIVTRPVLKLRNFMSKERKNHE